MQILQFHYNLMFFVVFCCFFLKFVTICKLNRVASYKALMWTQLRTWPLFFFFSFPVYRCVTKTFHNIHRWLPQWICMCYRTVNKYQFIKPQYLCFFLFLWEKCCLTIYCIYLYIVQIYLCIRDSKIQNIYILFCLIF